MSERELVQSTGGPKPETLPSSLEKAILRTVVYADLFDYPLTMPEVCRYLAGVAAPLSAVREALDNGLLSSRRLECSRGYVTLRGRESIVETRLRREVVSARMWRKGVRYGRAMASLPFVRMVAVTGTLAVNNAEPGHDIDYLIVTAPHRVWLARLFVLAFVHLARLERLTICPNYVLSSDSLAQFEPSFFAAHELVQMIPLYGLDVYQELLAANDWVSRYLPNAFAAPVDSTYPRVEPFSASLKKALEHALQGKFGDTWEAREGNAKIARLRQEAQRCGTNAAAFTPDCCKGHMDDHGNQIVDAYAQRLQQVGLDAGSAADAYLERR